MPGHREQALTLEDAEEVAERGRSGGGTEPGTVSSASSTIALHILKGKWPERCRRREGLR